MVPCSWKGSSDFFRRNEFVSECRMCPKIQGRIDRKNSLLATWPEIPHQSWHRRAFSAVAFVLACWLCSLIMVLNMSMFSLMNAREGEMEFLPPEIASQPCLLRFSSLGRLGCRVLRMAPNVELLRNSSGNSGPDLSFDNSASLERLFSLARVSLAEASKPDLSFGYDLNAMTIKYKIPHDLHPRLPSEEFVMSKLPDDAIGIYHRIFDFSGVRIPFSSFLLALIKHYRVYFSHLGPLGLNKVITFEVLSRSLQIEPTVTLFRVFRLYANKSGFFLIDRWAIPDAMVWRHSDATIDDLRHTAGFFNMADVHRLRAHVIKLRDMPEVMGIHDFLCLPEWTSAEVQEEPHLDVRSVLAQSSGSTTRPNLFVGDYDDKSDGDDDACVEIPLVTPLCSATVIPPLGNQGQSSDAPTAEGSNTRDSQGTGIMVDDAVAPSSGVSRQRPSSRPAPLFRIVSGDAIWNGYLTKRRKTKQKATKPDTGWKSVRCVVFVSSRVEEEGRSVGERPEYVDDREGRRIGGAGVSRRCSDLWRNVSHVGLDLVCLRGEQKFSMRHSHSALMHSLQRHMEYTSDATSHAASDVGEMKGVRTPRRQHGVCHGHRTALMYLGHYIETFSLLSCYRVDPVQFFGCGFVDFFTKYSSSVKLLHVPFISSNVGPANNSGASKTSVVCIVFLYRSRLASRFALRLRTCSSSLFPAVVVGFLLSTGRKRSSLPDLLLLSPSCSSGGSDQSSAPADVFYCDHSPYVSTKFVGFIRIN
ncbi:hypothetical protein Tco_0683292 [Tanacetum coccineum]|uniref:Transposase (putative) gypsy type domain-containing protein n=1 Tax=Tanacetum coccineum TaxID=301880 RepID=A0ABQ4XV99_9ASTR